MGQTYRELQNINNQKFSNLPTTTNQMIQEKPIDPRTSGASGLSRRLAGDTVYREENQLQDNPFASDYFSTKMWGFNLGDVTDKHKNIYGGLDPYSKAVDWEDLKRNEQSYFTKVPNLINQFIGKTALNTVGGIIGGFYGIGSAIANQDASKIFDNSVARGLDKASDWVDQNNSIFTSQRARDNAPLGLFSFETVKDIGDAYSFTAGAVLSEVLTGGLATEGLATSVMGRLGRAASFLDKTADGVKSAVGLGNGIKSTGNFITKSEELGKLLTSIDPNDINKLQETARRLGTTVEDLSKYRKGLDNFNSLVSKGKGIITGTFWEAGLEARHTKDEFISHQTERLDLDMQNINFKSEEEKQAYREKELAKIKEQGDVAGLTTFGLNTAVLGASNYIQFPTVFGKDATMSTNSMAGKITKKGLNEYIASGGKLKSIARTLGSVLKEPVSEATEEMLQNAINIGSKSYYESMLGTRTSDGEITPITSSFTDSMLKGLKETYTSSQGWHEGLVGAIVGAMGVPLFKKNASGKIRPHIEGGIAEGMREYKKEHEDIKEAIESLKLNKNDTLLSYNKDNAILSSQDAKKETVATLAGDDHAIVRLKDNIIFRHVQDRLDKGLETYLNQDVNDLKSMDLDTYKKSMNKDDDFTQSQKDKEVNDFSEKVDIYSTAYKKVFQGLQMDRINNNKVSKKYFDTLTYAVANEKILNKQQKEITDELVSNKHMELSSPELIELARLSDKFKNHDKQIKEYIKARGEERFNKKKDKIQEQINYVRSKVKPDMQSMFDDALENKEDTTGFLNSLIKLQKNFETDQYKDLAAQSEIILKNTDTLQTLIEEAKILEANKEKESKFDGDKSSIVRKEKLKGKDILAEVAKDIEKRSSETLGMLRGKKDSATLQELENYLELKDKADEAIFKDNKDKLDQTFLDNLENNNTSIKEKLDKLSSITAEQVTSLDIANNLYGLSKVNKAYSTIANAEFAENMNNIADTRLKLLLELHTKDDEDHMAELLANFKTAINNVKESLKEYGDLLSKEAKDAIIKRLDENSEVMQAVEKYLDNQDAKKEISKKTKKDKEDKRAEELNKEIDKKEKLQKELDEELDEELEGNVNNEEFDNTTVKLFSPKNLHTVKVTNSTEPDLVDLKTKLENGTIKYNSASLLTFEESREDNSGFKNYLKSKKITDTYISGKSKVMENPELLNQDFNDLDPDVKTFIIHSPVTLSIYDKQVELLEGTDQDFDIEEDDVPEQSIFYFSPDVDTIDDTVVDKYNVLKEDAKEEFSRKIEDNKEDKSISNEERNKREALLESQLNKKISDLDTQFEKEFNKINDAVLINFRQQLLSNHFNNGLNELKMRLGNILNGYLEKVGDTTWDVEEHGLTGDNGNVDWLIEKLSDVKPEDILYANQAGEYYSIVDSKNKVKLNEGSRVNKTTGLTSKMYYRFRTVNNQQIPVQLNRSKIGSNVEIFEEILHQLEEYFKENKKQSNIINLKNKSFSFLQGKTYKQFFRTFFDENNSGASYAGIDSLNIVSDTGSKPGVIYLGNLDLEIDSLETFNNNIEDIRNSISEMRFYVDKESFKSPDGFNRDLLDFIIKNKILNHSFNASTNHDRVFVPGFDKSAQFHILNTQVKKIKKSAIGKPKIKDLTNALKEMLGGKNAKNLSWDNVFYNINGDVIANSQKLFKISGNAREAVIQAMEETLDNKIKQALEVAKLFPNQYTPGLENEIKTDGKNVKILNGKIIDKYLRIVYTYKNKLSKREKTIDKFVNMLKNKNYNADYKNILLDKKISPVKMMIGTPVEVEEATDGKVFKKTKYKFDFSDALTEGTPEQNREKFNNIINAFSDLDKTTRKFIPIIYANSDKAGSAGKVFLDFSKSFVSGEGKQFENVYYHTVNENGIVSKGTGQSVADGKNYNLVQFKSKDGDKSRNAIEFKYINSNGEIVSTKTPLTDFEFNEDGTLSNGMIFINYAEPNKKEKDKSFPIEVPVLVGSNNNLNENNYIKTIKIPGLNQDFTVNEESSERLNELYQRFDTAYDELNSETINLYKDNKNIQGNIELEEDKEEKTNDQETTDEDDDFAMGQALINSFKQQPDFNRNTSEPIDIDKPGKDFSFIDDLAKQMNPGKDIKYGADFVLGEDEDIADEESNNVTNDKIEALSHNDLDEIEQQSSTIKRRLERHYTKWGIGTITNDKIKSSYNEFNANTYDKFVEMINIIYSDDADSLKKMITFANKIYNRKDENENNPDC